MTTAITRQTSRAIAVARVLCIACVIYVHLPPFSKNAPDSLFSDEGVIWIVREVLGRSSVPLLSIISGFLAIKLAGRLSYTMTLRKKAITLLLPLLSWNLIALALDAVLGRPLPHLADLPDLLLGIGGYPRILPLYFLRGIFLCAVLTPAMIWLLKRAPVFGVSALALNAVFDLDGPIFLSSAIPLFYFMGLGLGLGAWTIEPIARHPVVSATACAALLVLIAAALTKLPARQDSAQTAYLFNAAHVAQRCAGAVLFGCIAYGLSRKSAIVARFLAIEPAIFFVFCSHTLFIGVLWRMIAAALPHPGDWTTTGFFLIAPLMVVPSSIALFIAMRIYAPNLLKPLNAGRVPPAPNFSVFLPPGRKQWAASRAET